MLQFLGLKRKKEEETNESPPSKKAKKTLLTSSCTIKDGVITPTPSEWREKGEWSLPEVHRALNNIKKHTDAVCSCLDPEWSDFLLGASQNWNGNVFKFLTYLRDHATDRVYTKDPRLDDIIVLEIFHKKEEVEAMKDWNWLMGFLVGKHIQLQVLFEKGP